MSVTILLLPWFPIILGVGVGGRLLGRPQGIGLGTICAVFWLLLVQVAAGVGVWWNPLIVVALLAGAGAIIAMGAWSGEVGLGNEKHDGGRQYGPESTSIEPTETKASRDLQEVTDAMHQFEEWLEEHRNDADPWLAFDELLRVTLRRVCGARHIKPFRLRSDIGDLVPLRAYDPIADDHQLSARIGIIGHVVTSGRSFLAGDAALGALVAQLAADAPQPVTWCFPIKQGAQRFGVVVVSELDGSVVGAKPLLRACEKLVNIWWLTVREMCKSRDAVSADPVSGLNSRESFLRTAERALAESHTRGEPAALAVIAVERLRELNDSGRWETADELIGEVSKVLRRKVRTDDALGRFDESRFIVLLRRVDSELASLIVKQVLSQLTTVCQDTVRWGKVVPIRCGLAGSGTEKPEAQDLLARALRHCNLARERYEFCEDDLTASEVSAGVSP